jgi:predicted metalloprotease with PDZ domain
VAVDYDTLVDSPFEVGIHRRYEFAVRGLPHDLVVWGRGNLPVEQAIADIQKIVEVEAELFGGLPYDRYLFLLHLTPGSGGGGGGGGLEHKTSCSLVFSRLGFRETASYQRFLQLVAHEFFHLWNVKRIRPKGLEVFDYERENYTPSLWFSEGTTSYYDLLLPVRAGLYDASVFLQAIAKDITRLLTIPGRLVQPLAESSFDAWIKLYRRDAHSDNNQISYYLKGEIVSLLLDLWIRERHQNQRSLDDVMRLTWQRFGKDETGFMPGELQAVFEEVAGESLKDALHSYLETTAELPLEKALEPFGLRLETILAEVPYGGVTVAADGACAKLQFVAAGSPAERAGLEIGDEILAVDGLRVSGRDWATRLKEYGEGDRLDLTFFHQDELRSTELVLGAPQVVEHNITALASPSPAQISLCRGWLGVEPARL